MAWLALLTVAVLRADLAASCLRGALPMERKVTEINDGDDDYDGECDIPPVDLRAVCLVRAMLEIMGRVENGVAWMGASRWWWFGSKERSVGVSTECRLLSCLGRSFRRAFVDRLMTKTR